MAKLRFLTGTDINKLPTYSSSTVGQVYFLTDTTDSNTTKWVGKIIYDSPTGRLVMSTNALSAEYAGNDTTPIKDKYLTRLGWEGTSTKVEGYNGNNTMITSITLGDRVLPLAGGTMTGAINLANNVLNKVGDDASFGDHNKAGSIGIKGNNGATTLTFLPYSGNVSQSISTDGNGTMTVTGTLAGTFKGNLTGTASTATNLANAASWAWVNGTSAGPTATMVVGGKTTNIAAIPSASASISGVLTTGAQTIAGRKTFNNGVTLADDLNFSAAKNIHWNQGDVRQRLLITDDSTAGTAVFTFQQSTDTGANYTDLFTIKDDGTIIAKTFVGNVAGNVSGSSGSCTGNAATATKLQTARKINGTSFDGSADITTEKWGKSRSLSISATAGTTGTNVDGSANATLIVPSTMTGFASITSTKFIGALTGNASSATEFSAAKSITLTGDVTGTASSKAGWSIATTIADNAVTTSKIKNANVTNAKLQYSSMTIAGNSVSLGGTLTADTLRTSLGLSNALHFIGFATVAITDGSTTDPVISGYTTKTAGDVIIDKDKFHEYVWTGTAWEKLGGDSSYKVTQGAVASPSASGSTIAFIDTISQNANGVITATKKNVREASASQSGVVGTGAQTFAGNKTFSGQVYITNASDASSSTGNSGALIIGNASGEHLAIDGNEIMAKSNGTTTSTLYLNNDGGTIQVGGVIQPKANNTINLGTSSLKYNTVYATTFSGNATSANKVNKALTFGSKTYDGSSAQTITLADLGGQAAGNYKTVQTAISSPAASGNDISFIDTISQNANGVITATRKTARDASASQSGVVNTGTQSFAGVKTFNNGITLGGNINMGDVGTPSSYPYVGNKITWTGGTDGAQIYYQIDSADAGRLFLNMTDDTNALIALAYNGSAKSYINPSTPSYYPSANNTGSIGLSSNKWANMYATTFHGALDGTATNATNLTAAGTWTWTNGTTVGPTASLVLGGKTTNVGAIPSASASVSGIITTGAQTLTGVKTFNNKIVLASGDKAGAQIGAAYITAASTTNGEVVLQNGHLRFGGSGWDYNQWAGLKYDHSNKKIVLGLADGSEFTANSAQSGGTLKFVGISTVDLNKTASIRNLAVGGGIYWDPYVESASDASDAASITVLKSGAAGGTELRIQQANDSNDIINLISPYYIYLNSKKAFQINDSWLRINENNAFSSGIYTGFSLVRSDNQLQVGSGGEKFRADSGGNGYFSNTLSINRNIITNSSSPENGDAILTALGFRGIGYPIYTDPDFASGSNSISVYNNSGNGAVVHTREANSTCGNSSGYVIKITHNGSGTPGIGGFYQNISSKANAIFIQIFRAKIPSGYNVNTASNPMGNSYSDTWLTSTAGTGKWEWYARKVICGKDGSFSSGGHVYLTGSPAPTSSAPVVWYLSYCNCYEITNGRYDGLRSRYADMDSSGNTISSTYVKKSGDTMTGDLTAPSVYTSNWFRSIGSTGWYSETYQGGLYMTDSNFIRNYNLKALSINVASNNAWGIGGHRLAAVFKGNDHTSILLSTSSLGYGLCVNNDGNWYWGKRTTGSETSTSGDTYLLQGNTSLVRPSNNMGISLGQKRAAEFSSTYTRAINARHLDASGVYSSDMNLYIGYGNDTPTQKTLFYYSSGTHGAAATSRTQFAEINSNGLYALTRFGVNGQNTSYNLYVNGTSRFNNTLYFFNSTGDTNLSIESRRSKNSSNTNIETNTGLVTKNKSFIEIRGFAPPTMVRTTEDRPAPYGLGFGNGSESAGIMPIGEGDNLRELMFYGANSGPTLFTWKYQTWESTSYDSATSNGYSAAMMSLNSKTGDLYVKNTIGINGQNTGYNLYVNGTSYFNGQVTATQFNGLLNGHANSSTYLYADNSPYRYGDSNPYYAHMTWNTNGDDRWYLRAAPETPKTIAVDYAYDADKLDGYHFSDLESRYVNVTGDTMSGTLTTPNLFVINDSCNTAYDALAYFRHYSNNDWCVKIDAGSFNYGLNIITNESSAYGILCNSRITGNKVYGAVWNDYAEYRQSDITEPGRVVIENGDGTLSLSTKRLQRGAEVISDTYGFAIGETDECKTPIAATGRVLAYTYEPVEEYRSKIGWPVCSGPNGTVSIMTEEEEEKYPSRIIGTISEVPNYEEWGTGKVKTNGRVWIRIK